MLGEVSFWCRTQQSSQHRVTYRGIIQLGVLCGEHESLADGALVVIDPRRAAVEMVESRLVVLTSLACS